MKPQQILNKLAKYNKKVELSAEPMKVDLALAQNIDKYVKAANDYEYAGAKQYAELEKIADRKEVLLKELADVIKDGGRQLDLLIKELQDFAASAKELGIDPNSSDIYKRGNKASDVLFQAIAGWKRVYKDFK